MCDSTSSCGLVMEYMEYGDMEEYLDQNQVEYHEKLRMMSDVASGMKYLHNHKPPIIHGDFKIRNVLISGMKIAKVTDFSLSVVLPSKFNAVGYPGVYVVL